MAEKCSYCGEIGHSIQQCPKWKGKVATATEFPISKERAKVLLTLMLASHACRGFIGPEAKAARQKCISEEYKRQFPEVSKSIDAFADRNPEGYKEWLQSILHESLEKKEMSPSSPLVFTAQHLDKLVRLRSLVDYDMFEGMFTSAGGTVGMARHLWGKLQQYDVDLIKWWAELDIAHREIFIKMLNAWSGLIPLHSSEPSPAKRVFVSPAAIIPGGLSEAVVKESEVPMFTPAFLGEVQRAWREKRSTSFWDWLMEPVENGVTVTLRGTKKPHEFFPKDIIERMLYDETKRVYILR